MSYSEDLRSDLQDNDFALEYIWNCAKEGKEALRIGLKDLIEARTMPMVIVGGQPAGQAKRRSGSKRGGAK